VAVGIRVGSRVWTVGTGDFLHAFFSTVSYRLEPAGWGSRFPALLNELYQGELPAGRAEEARRELDAVQLELEKHPPGDVVWDVEDLSRRPPWGDDISPDITDLGNYFVTQDGRDLFEVLREALAEAARTDASVTLG
jgi:hypothetical protein